jgi:hypothetical protein
MTKGKGRAANALKHGAYSREIMLSGESRKEYKALLAALCEEWDPSGPTEASLVTGSVLSYGASVVCKSTSKPK